MSDVHVALAPPGLAPSDTTFDGFIYIGVRPTPACAGEPVSISVSACGCNVDLQWAGQPDGGAILIRAIIRPDQVCIQCDPRSIGVPIGLFAAGHYEIAIDRTLTFIHGDGSVDSSTTRTFFRFNIVPDCPSPTGVRYLNEVRIGAPTPCLECPPAVCAGDSIRVDLFGVLPNNCIRLNEVRVLPSPLASAVIGPPMLQIVYGIDSCAPPPCAAAPVPWQARVDLPPLPGRPTGAPYQLLVSGVIEDNCHAIPDQPVGNAAFPFIVTDPCSTAVQKCFRPAFEHSGQRCDATWGADHPASITFGVSTYVPLAGLQGTFSLDAPALEIVNIEAVGVAAGMHLLWTHEPGGAKFVLLSHGDAPIWSPLDYLPLPLLRVDVRPNPLVDSPLPEVAYLAFEQLLASDIEGHQVPECPPYPNVREADPRARICGESACDFNGDGSADVRDLVLMVRCVSGTGGCPDPIDAVDCDRDHDVDLDDVLCCASVVLGGAPPDSVPGRPEPRVTARLDPPVVAESGLIEIPLRLGGTDYVGAARLELRYPSSRYEIASVETPRGSHWLALSQDHADRLVLAMIGVPSIELAVVGHESWLVRLRLRAGQVPGGDVALTSAQFSGPDGVGLVTTVAPQSVPLGAAGSIALSTLRPNPFGVETGFSVNLVSPSTLDIAVFDLAGRKVATVFRGVAPAGVNDFAWRGVRDDGVSVPGGVYFVRVSAAGRQVGRKVLFVPGAP